MRQSAYTPLHLSSCYSFGCGILTPECICRQIRLQGYRAVGLVDRHNFCGLVRFLRAAEQEGVKPIAGMTLLREGRAACTAYVLDRRGYRRLNQVVSRPQGGDPVHDLLTGGWEGLALLSDEGQILERLLGGGREGLYVGLTYGRPFRHLMALARRLGLPPLAINRALFIERTQESAANLLRAIFRRCQVDDLPEGTGVKPEMYLAGGREMERFFSAVPESLEAARALARQACSEGILPAEHVFPSFRGMGEEQSFRLLRRLCLEEAQRRYGRAPEPPPSGPGGPRGALAVRGIPAGRRTASSQPQASSSPAWRERLEYELRVIRKRRFCGYFLVVREIVRRCRRTCGRGSSAASLVSYLLGITHVDPIRHGLDFDRFLNEQRGDPPDIDVDFPWDERESVLRRVFADYPGRSALVADHVTFGPRSAMRESARAFGLQEGEVEKMVEFFRRGEWEWIPPYLLSAARAIQGLPRHLGTHCGGVVITPEAITHYTHLQSSPLGYPVMAWDRRSAEGARLVKIDLLGNRSLAVLRDASRLASGRGGCRTGGSWRPSGEEALGDAQTRCMIAGGDTLGLFYVESPATRLLLRKMSRGDYEHLIIAGSIIRPAANPTIREFLRRLHGAPYRSPVSVLDRSYGLMVYQEDLARVTAAAAGFTAPLAEGLRQALVARGGARPLEEFRRLFFRRGAMLGSSRAALAELWEMIRSFRGYSFCKAHSASYALVAFRLAYLKCHFPAEFFVSVINNGGGFYSRQTYLNECRRLGIRLLLPDVNRSRMAYCVEEGAIRVGLGQLRHVSRPFLLRLLTERGRGGSFGDLADFCRRVRPGLMEARILIRSGAMDGISQGMSRPQLLWCYLRAGRCGELFAAEAPPAGDYPEEVKLLHELRTLGLMVSRHPVSLFRSAAGRLARGLGFPAPVPSSELGSLAGREVGLVGLAACGKEVLTRGGGAMAFLSFEDEFSLFETVLFPSVLARYRPCFERGGVMLLCGRVEQEMGARTVTVRRIAQGWS